MTEKELKNIWAKPIYLPYLQPDLTDEMLQDAENQIGYKLPAKLIEILKVQNGGYIRYKLGDTPHRLINGIGSYFPSMTDFSWDEEKEYVSFELDGLVPLDGDGHWYLCLDYRKNKENPKISYIDVECDEESVIAENFDCYLKMLKLDTRNYLVIETDKYIENIIPKISQILNIKFEEPNYFNHGYAEYRSKYNDSWIWITPNKVPDGFIRKNEKRYEEMKVKMELSALRFPELAETYSFINLSDKNLETEIIEKLSKNNIKLRQIEELIRECPNR